MKPRIVMLSGVSCSGKDTVADFLIKERGYIRLAFADVLKEFCSTKYKIPLNIFHSQSGKASIHSNGLTIRKILIKEALEQRSLYVDTFVDHLIKKIKLLPDSDIVISDYRYYNEYAKIAQEFCNSRDIKTYQVLRPDVSSVLDSDNQLNTFNFDYYIYNYSTIPFLYSSLSGMF